MIAFGTAIIDAEAYRRYAGRASSAPPRPDSAIYAFAALGLDLPQLQPAARRARPRATTSRRWCSSTSTPRSPTRTSARKVRRRR